MTNYQSIEETKMFLYASEVIEQRESGRFCQWIIKAAERFFRDLERDDIYIDFTRVNQVVNLFEMVLCVPELGRPNEIYPPHAFWIEQLYGWHYKETGLRRFTEVYAQMGRKQFKTYWAACISLAELILGKDLLPEIMVGANSREQAIICTKMIGKIVKATEDFDEWQEEEIIHLYEFMGDTHKVKHKLGRRDGEIKAMPKNPGDGGNPSVLIVDELHEAENLNLMETGKSGQGQRQEPLSIVITSPGHNKYGVCYTVLRKSAIDNLNQDLQNDRQLAIIFELDDEEDWDNIDKLEQSNPMMPYSPTLRPYLKERIQEAKSKKGVVMVNVKIKNSGIWVDAASVWIPSDQLKANNHGLTEEDLKNQKCTMAYDFSKGMDLTCVGWYFPDVNGRHVYKCIFWLPEERINKDNKDAVDYQLWIDEQRQRGLVFIRLQPGDTLDLDAVVKEALKEIELWSYVVLAHGCDPKYASTGAAQTMVKLGGATEVFKIGQGYALSGAIMEIENLIVSEEFHIMYNPVLYWCFANVIVILGTREDRMLEKSDYRTTRKKKIDGVVVLVTARETYNRWKQNDDGKGEGYFAMLK